MSELKSYSGYQLAAFRMLLALYLLWFLVPVIPYAGDVYSAQGMLSDARLNWTYHFFPNVLLLFDSPLGAQIFLAGICLLAALLLIGFKRRIVALLLWYGWACLLNRNNYTINPSYPIIGWLLLALALIPSGEPLCFRGEKDSPAWRMPPAIFWAAWAVMAITYSVSGFLKLSSPSWIDSSAVAHSLTMVSARSWFLTDFVLSLHPSALAALTKMMLLAEVLFLPIALFHWGRALVTTAVCLMHAGLLLLFIFPELTLGMLLMHLFTFDARWIPARSGPGERVIFFDGVCALCDGLVSLLIAEDYQGIYQVAPLQGAAAHARLPEEYPSALKTIVFLENGRIYSKSNAVLRILTGLGGLWKFTAILYLIPRFLRDGCYDFIANKRYRWFGKREQCRLPEANERDRFLE